MAEDDRDRILALAARFGNVMLRFQPFDIERYSHFRTDGHISHASYLRIFIPEILPDSVEKVLYLDCDIVVRNDIAALWNLSLGDKVLGAARNLFFVRHDDLDLPAGARSEEHTSELQSLMRTSYAVFCLKKKTTRPIATTATSTSYQIDYTTQDHRRASKP